MEPNRCPHELCGSLSRLLISVDPAFNFFPLMQYLTSLFICQTAFLVYRVRCTLCEADMANAAKFAFGLFPRHRDLLLNSRLSLSRLWANFPSIALRSFCSFQNRHPRTEMAVSSPRDNRLGKQSRFSLGPPRNDFTLSIGFTEHPLGIFR